MKYLAIISLLLLWQPGLRYEPNPVPKAKHRFVVIAHRGNHYLYPENTLKAYEQAIKYGADYIEIDLRTSSDGQLVSLHDASVTRMTGAKGDIKDLTLQQIESLKINAKSKTDTAVYHIPTFEQILKLTKDKIYIYIDFKEADATQVYNMLKEYHMERQAIVYINKPTQFTDWRKAAPKMPLMLSLPDSVNNIDGMRQFLNKYHPDILDGNYESYDKKMIEFTKYFDIPVWPDGQSALEGPLVWDRVISVGLKGLQTDNIPGFVSYLMQRNLR